jgi:hypothetical protein
VDNKCSAEELEAAVAGALQPPLLDSERIVLLQGSTYSLSCNAATPPAQLADGHVAHTRIWAFRVPAPAAGPAPAPAAAAPPGSSHASPDYVLIGNSRGSDYDGRNAMHPVLLPLDPQHLRGGPAAARALAEGLIAAARPYRQAGEPAGRASSPPFAFKRTGYMPDQMGPFSETRGAPLQAASGRAVASLEATWREAAAGGYDLAAFGHPEVAASASAEALKESEELAAALKSREEERRRRKDKPRTFVEELATLVGRSKPGTPAAIRNKPSLAYRLDLEPAEGGGGRCGTAVLKLYTWASPGANNDTCFEDFEASWGARGAGYISCAWANVMEVRPPPPPLLPGRA